MQSLCLILRGCLKMIFLSALVVFPQKFQIPHIDLSLVVIATINLSQSKLENILKVYLRYAN